VVASEKDGATSQPAPHGEAGSEVIPTGPPPRKQTSRGKQLLQWGLTILVVVLVFGFVIPQLADYEQVLDVIDDISPAEWIVLALLATVFLLGYMFVLMATLASLRFREAFVVQTTATAINNSIPAGGALSLPVQYAMYMSWGFTAEAVTASFLAAGVWDQTMRLALPVLAVTLIAFFGQAAGWMWLAALIGIAMVAGIVLLLIMLFRSESFAAGLGARLGKIVNWGLQRLNRAPADMVTATLQFRANVIGIVQRRWGWLTAATLLNNLAQVTLFVGCLRVVGVSGHEIATAWIILSYSLGRLLVAIPISPGGVGLVDLGYIGLLVVGWSGGGADQTLITSAVLLFRVLSWLPPIPLGLGSWIFWRVNKSWRHDWRTHRRGEFVTVEAEPGS
jgi:uncharacterized membrane protein YbhN (UPF0104 family)